MQKIFRVRATYPSGHAITVDIRPGSTNVVTERAVNDTGELLNTVTLEPKENGGYVCVETGKNLRVRYVKVPLVLSMDAACFYVGMVCKNKLGLFTAEWAQKVEPVDEYYPEMIDRKLSDENTSDAEKDELMAKLGPRSLVQALQADPSKKG